MLSIKINLQKIPKLRKAFLLKTSYGCFFLYLSLLQLGNLEGLLEKHEISESTYRKILREQTARNIHRSQYYSRLVILVLSLITHYEPLKHF